MKETPLFEEVFNRLCKLPGFWVKLLIGGLLSFVPVVNVFAFGYLLRVSRKVRASGQPTLPAWEDWRGLFLDGLRFAVVWLAYWLLPVLLGCALSQLLDALSLGALSYLLCAGVFLLSPVLFISALYRYTTRRDFKDLLDVVLIVRMMWFELPRLILPALVFMGIFALLLPLYGFALFGGFLMLITFSSMRYRRIEQNNSVAL